MTDHPAAKLDEIEARLNAIDGAPWKYENRGQTVFGFSPGGCNKAPSDYMVANIRGWGHLQYMGETRGDAKAQAMQDANGEFIAHAPTDIRALLDIARQAIALGERDDEALREFANKTAKAAQQIHTCGCCHALGWQSVSDIIYRELRRVQAPLPVGDRDAVLEEAAKKAEAAFNAWAVVSKETTGETAFYLEGKAEGAEIIMDRIRALQAEADNSPCAEDASVHRGAARLVRADFSYEDTEWLQTATSDKPAQEQHIVLDLYRREDGGLRIAGRGDARGLVLSDQLPGVVLHKVWSALFALKHPITVHDYDN